MAPIDISGVGNPNRVDTDRRADAGIEAHAARHHVVRTRLLRGGAVANQKDTVLCDDNTGSPIPKHACSCAGKAK